MSNFLADDEENWSKRDIDLEKDVGNGMDEICEQGESFKENLIEKDTFASDQKKTVKISGHLIKK